MAAIIVPRSAALAAGAAGTAAAGCWGGGAGAGTGAAAGGGAVEATVSGKKELLKIALKEEVVDPEDVEMLQDLIVAAVNEALRKAEEASSELMGKMTGGLGGMPF